MNSSINLFEKGFVSSTANVNGTTLHYVRGGAGPAIILLHGSPLSYLELTSKVVKVIMSC